MRPPEEVKKEIVRQWLAKVDVRYPGDQPEPTLEETRRAVELARMVRDNVLPLLPTKSGGRER